MALFKFLKSDNEKEVVVKVENKEKVPFNKTTIATSDISKDLEKIASKSQISVKELDFKILFYKTFYKKNTDTSYQELSEDKRREFFKLENLLAADLKIKQKIKIEVFQKNNSSKFPIKMSISGNKSMTQIIATMKKQDNIQYFDGLEGEIIAELNRRKAKIGLLLGVRDKCLYEDVEKLISVIKVNKKIDEDFKVRLCEGIDPFSGGTGEIIYHYKKNSGDVNETDKVDHANRGFMNGVKKGDLLFEHSEPKAGHIGRDCKGQIIENESVKIDLSAERSIKICEHIIKEERDGRVLYIANKDGYINDEDDGFQISDELVVDSVNFKATGSIEGGNDKDIKINIKGNDALKDAIGAGVKIETSELNAAGNVGDGAEIMANKVEIGGQTHQNSTIISKDVKVNIHKGSIEGENVEINSLEGGKITADIVRVNKISGGEIFAREIYIDTVLANSSIYASHHIEIQAINGIGNSFVIDSSVQRGFKEKVRDVETRLNQTESDIIANTKKVKQLRMKISNDQGNIKKINEKIAELKASNTKPPASFIMKLKDNNENIKLHNSLLKEIKDGKIMLVTLNEELEDIQSSVFEAKVINRTTWKEYNEVKFITLKPPIEVSFLPKEGEFVEELSLQKGIDGEFEINRKG